MSPNRAGTRRKRVRPTWVLALNLAVILASCTSLPPARPVAEVKVLAGNWEGEVMTRNGPHHFRSTVTEDGSSLATVPTRPPGTFHGRYSVEKGTVRFVSQTTGRAASCTLHEGDGQRVLACRADDGTTTSEAQPFK